MKEETKTCRVCLKTKPLHKFKRMRMQQTFAGAITKPIITSVCKHCYNKGNE